MLGLLVKTGVGVLVLCFHRSGIREEAHTAVFHEVEDARGNLSERGATMVCVCVCVTLSPCTWMC